MEQPQQESPSNGYYSVRATFGFPGQMEAMLLMAMGNVAHAFPNTLRTMEAIAGKARDLWVEYASGQKPLPDGRTVNALSGNYHRSIDYAPAPPDDGSFLRYEVFSTDPKAAWLEHGTDAWDMKKLLQTSHQVRESAQGKRYLIIPFRWGTPGTLAVGALVGREMPAPVYSFWLDQDPRPLISQVTGSYTEPSLLDPAFDATRYRYQWGDRLTPKDLEALGIDPEGGAGRNLVGMVRMRNYPEEAPTRGFQHQYLTFRVMSEDSAGWQHPGIAAYEFTRHIHDWLLQAGIDDYLETAMSDDIARLERLAQDGPP